MADQESLIAPGSRSCFEWLEC